MQAERCDDPESHHTHQQHQAPEADPNPVDRAKRRHEKNEHEQLDYECLGVERRQAGERLLGRPAPRSEQDERGRPRRGARRDEQGAQPRTVRPDGAVRDREEDPRVAGNEDAEQAGHAPDHLREPPPHGAAYGAERRIVQPPLLCHAPEGREDREESEQEKRPGPEGDGRPSLEHERRDVRRLEQHVPEPQRPSQIDRQERAREDRAPGGDVVPGADDGPILRPAEPVHHRREEAGAPGDPAHEEVQDDEPGPVRCAAEEGVGH